MDAKNTKTKNKNRVERSTRAWLSLAVAAVAVSLIGASIAGMHADAAQDDGAFSIKAASDDGQFIGMRDGHGRASIETPVATAPNKQLAAIAGLKCTVSPDRMVSLAWEPKAEADTYKLEARTSSGEWQTLRADAHEPSFQISSDDLRGALGANGLFNGDFRASYLAHGVRSLDSAPLHYMSTKSMGSVVVVC